jgi:hypothetical protein
VVLASFTAAGTAPGSATEAGAAAALVLARADAGVLDPSDTRDTEQAVLRVLGAARLAQLRNVWRDNPPTNEPATSPQPGKSDTANKKDLGILPGQDGCAARDLNPEPAD